MTEFDAIVDIRQYERPNKYLTINKTFNTLEVGQKMKLINDHDFSKMFDMKLGADFPNQFTWNFTQEGPEVWIAEVTKLK